WGERVYYASDYFEKCYELAEVLIRKGKAYVDSLSAEEISAYRGTAGGKEAGITPPGKDSPYRNRSVEENLDLFRRMRAGEFPDGAHVLRAKIDMAHPNINMRDPVLFRIMRARHHRTGDRWLIYPMYDYAHPISDALENITHSICTLEFEAHRPLYDWVLRELVDHLPPQLPQQIEFARLNLTYTVLSKRRLLALVQEKHVNGWDDPRMATLTGLGSRGSPPPAIRVFCARIGVAKADSRVDIHLLEHCLREDLNRRALRRLAVLRPLRLVIENYPEGQVEEIDALNNPEDMSAGTRRVPFSRILWIEQEDFREYPPPKYYRLSPGQEVRLRYAYLVRCLGCVKDETTGEIKEVRCVYDPATRGGEAPDGRKVKGTIHWLSAAHAQAAEIRLYDYLFTKPDPDEVEPGKDWRSNLNPRSLEIVPRAWVEPALAACRPGEIFQFERLGYFCVDPETTPQRLVFNRTVTLKDSWAKIAQRTT
ncbi:MAG: glutamine--tRNA ligase, partial [Planctomycetota bacterium]|nr:glutamine--tRNA ligase [Planctomycetota bacterium]